METSDERDEMTESMHDSMSLDGDSNKLQEFYDKWASTYDADVELNYEMPVRVASTLRQAIESRSEFASIAEPTARIVDAGCGTGAVGAELADLGWTNIHGLDLSHEMLKLAAERNVYKSLTGGVDLTAPIRNDLARSADAVTVGGVFTVGHIPPQALRIVASIVRPGGVLAISAREAYLKETDFMSVQQQLCDEGVLETLLHIVDASYTMDSDADYFAWHVL